MYIKEYEFGTTINGESVKKITIGNSGDLEFSILDRGATLQSFKVANKDGKMEECILGFDNVKDYEDHLAYYGATVGRVANRIAGGEFTVDGTQYNCVTNDGGKNCLHGGTKGFDKVIWSYETFQNDSQAGVIFNYLSVDGEENFPGNLNVTITFTLDSDNNFTMDYSAETDKATPVNLTNHAYWNLSGFKENIYSHNLEVSADSYLSVDGNLIPTGEFTSVKSTPFDFRKLTNLGDALKQSGGYDHNFNFSDKKIDKPLYRAYLEHPESGRSMEVKTTEPGVQIYTGFDKHEAICLETQIHPDAVNHNNFPSSIIRPGEVYRQTTIHKFKIEK